ncbi:Ankyrin repeat protein [uncultured virus]|nr:Ankyrin repeat protein [uncultured virus]
MENTPDKDDFHTKTRHINTLFRFVKDNKESQFLEYLSSLNKDEVDINMQDENGNYLITIAVVKNFQRILKKVIEYGSRLDIIDSDGFGLLYHPIKLNYRGIIDVLLENDNKLLGISLINLRDMRGAVPIFYAIKYQNDYALQELLTHGADANYRNKDNMNALHLAVLRRDITIVKLLIKHIKNLNARTKDGSTALHYACNFQSYDIVKLLLEAGASQNVFEFEYDFIPIFYTVVENNVAITKLLVDNGANPNHQDYMGNTIIHYAIINNHTEILDYIIEHYPISTSTNVYVEDINDKNDISADHIDPNIVNIDGLSIVHLLLYNYRSVYAPYLRKLLPVANLNYQDNIGNTPLHLIAENDLWQTFAPQLDTKKLNIFIRNSQSKTIFDLVRASQREEFLTTIIRSYYNYLLKHKSGWLLEWQNACAADQASTIDETKCLQLIRTHIITEKASVPALKDKITIEIAEDETVHFSTFTGSLLDLIAGFKYLTLKYPLATTMLHTDMGDAELQKYTLSLGIQDNPNQHLIHFEIRWIYQQLFLPPHFETTLSSIIQARSHRYIILPIGIILSNGNHSNGLFIDLELHTIERFEPHGSSYPTQFNYNPELLDDILYRKLSNIFTSIYRKPVTIKYYKPSNYLPKIGFQTFESAEVNMNKNIGDPNGFCTLWTIWYFDYRLKYVRKKPQNIVKNLISQIRINNYSFRTIMRNYSKKITDLRDDYLNQIGRNINDYLNNRLSTAELEQLTQLIVKGAV